MRRARWNGPGSLSTPSGAARAGSDVDADHLSDEMIRELTRSGALTLLNQARAARDLGPVEHSETILPAAPAPVAEDKRKRGKR